MKKLDKLQINGLTLPELVPLLREMGIETYRAKQIFQWIHQKGIHNFTQMHNLPKRVMVELEDRFTIAAITVGTKRLSFDKTEKFLFALIDNQTIEAVFIPEGSRNTVCASSQVGCAMACTFCATGAQGYNRSLSAGEIAAQIEYIERCCQTVNASHITNVVFMGMGEPLANYDELLKAITILNHPDGLNIGMRKFTISTCGIVPKIYQLAQDNDQIGLAVSLHAPTDRKRSAIMPINKTYPIRTLIEACRHYTEKTRRRITFEYALIHQFNDTLEDINELKILLGQLLCHVNVIPVNPVSDHYMRPTNAQVAAFVRRLTTNNVPASIRRERGSDIEAACGQLRQATQEEKL